MPYYHPCPRCGANLDPGEVCDCVKNAAPGATNTQDGKAENYNASASILPEDKEDCQV